MTLNKVLVIGGTGYLGGKVIDELLKKECQVFALVRENSDSSKLKAKGVTVVTGDLTNSKSLSNAMEGIDSVISTAIGYSNRKKEDSLENVDGVGNQNLIDVIAESSISRFVFMSILACDKAKSVPHFWQKKVSEDYMKLKDIPFIALRAGAFLDQDPKMDMHAAGLKKGVLKVFGPTSIEWSHILTDDLANLLAISALDESMQVRQTINIGMSETLSPDQFAQYISEYTGSTIKVKSLPWPVIGLVLRFVGLFKPMFGDAKKMFDFFFTGEYVGDFSKQKEIFGKVPSAKESVFRYCQSIGLIKK